MKREVIVAIVLSAMALIAADKTTSSRSESFSISKDERHHTLTFTNFEAESEYSVSVGASGGKFVSASAPSGIIVTPADQSELFSSATATKTAGALPDSFNFVFSGYFRPDGDADAGSDLPWDIDVEASFYTIESGNSKDIISLVGESVTFNSYVGAELVDSSWLIIRQAGGTCTKSISSNFNFSDDISATSWCVPGTSNVDGDNYTIKGTYNSTGATDQGTLKVVAPDTIKLSSTFFVSNDEYGKSLADKTFIRGDQDRSAVQVTVTTKPAVNYEDIPADWVGVSTESYSGANIAALYTPDSSQPKLKGTIIPDVLGCVGYLYAGGKTHPYQKFIRFIKFGIVVIPSNPIYDLYVFKTKNEHESIEFSASVDPPYMFNTVDTTTKFTWEILEGDDKVSIEKSGVRDETCVVTAKGVDKLSTTAGDVKLKVTWNYNGVEKGEKEISLTVRSIWSLNITSNSRPDMDIQKWIVTYSLLDNLGTPLPDDVCAGLRAYESFAKDLWEGRFPSLGHPILSSNHLTDTFMPIVPVNYDGDGIQTITIDHMKRTHHISIPIIDNSVKYSDITYEWNQ